MTATAASGLHLASVFHGGALSSIVRCQRCGLRLSEENDDDLEQALCEAHKKPRSMPSPREFNDAELAMINRLHRFMPTTQLLHTLNERLAADAPGQGSRFTMNQLEQAIAKPKAKPHAMSGSWADTRKQLSAASRAGTLALVDEQLIDDFAIVYSLNARQVMMLKDIVLPAAMESRE
jgi:hypothetical protein